MVPRVDLRAPNTAPVKQNTINTPVCRYGDVELLNVAILLVSKEHGRCDRPLRGLRGTSAKFVRLRAHVTHTYPLVRQCAQGIGGIGGMGLSLRP